ncbi:calponin homology domain-containing protein DDB_G0272472 isoform X2 [Eurytemora carolleeae]|uniref:calponin homology domain-containing protein DDB_G0272472 isoform X2 n=1 Tax=Eurytemora carolleeae TaxID=1294199 RepID=UPI000C765242|nr:calponin homology domain-containing protein DDB_G0272472 isoform X2 [Eurytemora carolleeae]|eukprot:XP_023328843.1 calponin homology domain-containing protein DDB_G0272472-like isoform X2 [Eurytemora affinis]
MSGVEDLKVLTGEPVSGENQNFSHDKSDILNDEEHIETDKVPDGTLDDPDIRDSNLKNEIINLETTAVKSRMQVSIDKCDWTLVEKEDIPKDFDEGFSRSVTQEDVYNSLNSQTSTISDGIPIKNSLDGGVDEQYLWNRDGEQELQESEASVSDMLDEIPAEKEEERDTAEEREKAENVDEVRIENNEQDENVEDNVAQQEEEVKVEDGDDYENEDGEENDEYDDRHNADDENNVIEPVEELERGEPGIDEDDDGFRGNFLVRLLGDLYPSQELDPGFSRIRRGEVYKHNKNFQLNSLLTAILVLMAALVIGLGIGHFLGVLFSVSLGIPSTYLGLGPHPEQGSTFGLGLDFTQDQLDHQFMHGGRTPVTHKEGISDEYDLERMKDSVINSDFGSVLGGIKKVLSNLGSKFGYLKKTPGYHGPTPNPETGTSSAPKLEAGPTPTPDSESDPDPTTNYESEQTSTPNSEPKSNPGQTSDPEHTQFQCMSDTHNPILLEGEPVLVTEPQDCHKYFMDFAAFADPQLVFMEEARAVFKRMSEKLEVVEMYDQIQEEKLCHLQDELVTCISGVEGQGGDDQDLDDRVIRALWEENQELRDQVHHLKSNIGDTREEAMTAILRDRINNLLTANGDLEREVARLRYAEAARGAAESIESLEQLRKTRDALNNIVDENDQLKIQVGKYRYGAAPNSAAPNTRAPNSAAPITDEDTVIDYDESGKAIDDSDDADVDIEVDSPEINENNEMSISSKVQKEDLSESWPMRRQHDIKREEERRQIDKDGENEYDNDNDDYDNDNDDDDGDSETVQKTNEYDNTDEGYVSDKKEMKHNEESWEKKSTNQNKPNDDRKIVEDDEHEHPVLKDISRKIAKKLSKFGSKLFDAAGEINWEDTKHFFSGLQEDIGVKLSSLGGLNLNIFQEKFAEIRGFVEKGELEGHVEPTKMAARKLLKSLMHSVKDLQEAAKDATEKSSWNNQLNEEISKIKMKMERSWTDIKNTWTNIINQKMDKDQQKDSPDSKYKRSQDEKRVKKIKEKEKKNNRRQEEKEYGRKFAEERRETENIKIDETKRQEHKKDIREKENKRSRKQYKRERGNEKMKKEEEEDEDWTSRRGMGRSLKRNQESKGDWVFERARQRKNVRLEDEKEDWYEARKRRRSRGEDCDDDCENERGECEGEKCYAIKR